ncbi:2-C-methyl-D-erythritol 2,4-cyclodiphosphate synthase [Candidatus Borkfalkia ceftriaxoniphila]|uniref:Bifunctional enzyme IspD/IspF n=1 Tax=Candidatus Borkfalkia ceftriaxoniphila TaxID=2508949 RepID=A0A4Q2KE28_9FIRM|nr:2-C-methyl-D-erythritol 2,4-cyclodiphosphate synthase [Candidatus Borkfalkia ceftriaxoniphila]RXZ62170.1 2-C-methyl-D-erythritol 2,4-cyclodiphosphate synthase [Candidatus Borkfalkia ceftriaxoniphila]
MKISAVVPAAGAGARAGFSKNKLLTFFRGEPVLYRTVSALSACESIGEIVIAAAKRDIAEISAMFEKFANVRAVCGGDTRTQSVLFALRACDSPDYVLIHDGARPFVTQKILNDCIETVRAHGSAVCALPVTDTIALCAEEKIGSIPDRSALYALQTPQAFSYAEILAAYEKIGGETFTDDSGVYAKFVAPPQIFAGDVKNKKLTFREDFLSDPLPAPRVGVGIDTHAFGKAQDHIVLGGARIPSESGLIAHSDGDVLVHAVMDALLSAAALPDIGHFFPDTDPAFADADSLRLLERVRDLLAEKRFAPRNVSAAIQAERPRLQKYIFSMRENIARALRISPDDVGLSAGTNEGLGYVGEGKGITVTAYVSLAETD